MRSLNQRSKAALMLRASAKYFCHSERSEESLFGLNAEKERFLGARRASE
jgi:hypothetical protein